MEKYNTIINAINSELIAFLKFLNTDIKITLFDENRLNDTNITWKLKENGWSESLFPSGNSPGVYFILGSKKDDDSKIGVYVGKASHNSCIGKRLYSHLSNPKREEKIYTMRDLNGDDFLLELVITIPLDEIDFFAPALEEFFIYKLQKMNIYLLNCVGKN